MMQRTLEGVISGGEPVEIVLCWNDDEGLEHCYLIRFVPEFVQEVVLSSVLANGRDVSALCANQRQLHELAY